jgi:quinol monooxygenase YgiN
MNPDDTTDDVAIRALLQRSAQAVRDRDVAATLPEHYSVPSPEETSLVVVSGALHLRPGKRDEFLALSRDAIVAARRSPGCRDFVVAADPLEEDRVNVYEVWDSERALLAFRGAGPGPDLASLVVRADVRRHRIASSGPA